MNFVTSLALCCYGDCDSTFPYVFQGKIKSLDLQFMCIYLNQNGTRLGSGTLLVERGNRVSFAPITILHFAEMLVKSFCDLIIGLCYKL